MSHSPTAQLGQGAGSGRRTTPTTCSPTTKPLGPGSSTRPRDSGQGSAGRGPAVPTRRRRWRSRRRCRRPRRPAFPLPPTPARGPVREPPPAVPTLPSRALPSPPVRVLPELAISSAVHGQTSLSAGAAPGMAWMAVRVCAARPPPTSVIGRRGHQVRGVIRWPVGGAASEPLVPAAGCPQQGPRRRS